MNSTMPQTEAPNGPDDSERLALEAKLRQLALKERRLADLDNLRRKVADKRGQCFENEAKTTASCATAAT